MNTWRDRMFPMLDAEGAAARKSSFVPLGTRVSRLSYAFLL
ncbi:MAG: hypothetical protein U0K75_06145 [Christensenellaceae bacterium]|nr:hypothetical protein [Christensenellaceae bacterium]